ncbi:MAG: MFS transporter [Casimicrobiaceae bacterium]
MSPNRWLILLVLFLARTAMGFQFQSVAAVSPILVESLALDFALLGTLIGVWMLPGVAVAIPGSVLARRLGDKNVVLSGLVLMVLGSALTASAETYAVALMGRIVAGTGAALLNVLLAKMVADWFADRELATAMSLLVVSWPLGIGLALVVLGPLSLATSWGLAIQMTAWVCVLALTSVALVYQRPESAGKTDSIPSLSWRLSRPHLVLACMAGLIWTFYNVGYIVVVSFAPVMLAEQGRNAANAAIVASFATWPLIATVPLGGVLADRTGRGHAIMIGCFVAMATAMPLMLVVPSPLLMLAIIGIVAGPAAGVIMALPARALPQESRNLGMGVFFTLYYLGMASLPGIAGRFRDLSGFRAAPLLFGSLLLIFAAACALVYRRLEAKIARLPR